jgi:hypothetical protein
MKPANPRILTINGGSSSIKFALFETGDALRRILSGSIERIGLPEATFRVKGLDPADNFARPGRASDHTVAVTYRRTNHGNIHVRGYKEESTITTPFDMTVLNELDRFHLVMDAIDRLPRTGDKGIYLKQQLKDKLIEHKQYINMHGQDMPEIRNWKWSNPK